MKKQTITVSVESTPGPLEVYSVAAQAGDGPKSEAHDDWFPLETAQEVAKEMRQASPNTTVNLNLNPTDQ